jgi:hypothetical protein
MKNRRLTTIDENEVMAQVRRIARKIGASLSMPHE